MKLSILTATFNRGDLLQRLYESIIKNLKTNIDVEWLIMDDGSNDDTEKIISNMRDENKIYIRYLKQVNQGKMAAINHLMDYVRGDLIIECDSDDYFTENAFLYLKDAYEESKYEKDLYGLCFLKYDQNGNNIGSLLPQQKSIAYNDFYEYGGRGDKKVIYRTDIITKYPPYPEYEGEKFVGLCYKYLLADQEYPLLILNEPICVVEYLEDGSTRNIFKQFKQNPRGYIFLRKERMKYCKTFKWKFKSCIHYVCESIDIRNIRFLSESPRKFMTMASIPFGILLYFYINYKTKDI